MRISDWSSDVCSSDLPQSAITAPCEQADPFGDESSALSPLALALRGSSGFDLAADVRLDSERDPDHAADDSATAAQATIPTIPAAPTALVHSPPEGGGAPPPILATAPGASPRDAHTPAHYTRGAAHGNAHTRRGGAHSGPP